MIVLVDHLAETVGRTGDETFVTYAGDRIADMMTTSIPFEELVASLPPTPPDSAI